MKNGTIETTDNQSAIKANDGAYITIEKGIVKSVGGYAINFSTFNGYNNAKLVLGIDDGNVNQETPQIEGNVNSHRVKIDV